MKNTSHTVHKPEVLYTTVNTGGTMPAVNDTTEDVYSKPVHLILSPRLTRDTLRSSHGSTLTVAQCLKCDQFVQGLPNATVLGYICHECLGVTNPDRIPFVSELAEGGTDS